MNKKLSITLFASVVMILLIVASGAVYYWSKNNQSSDSSNPISKIIQKTLPSEVIVPSNVSLSLKTHFVNNERIPFIELSAVAGPDSCTKASELKIKTNPSSDTLSIDIAGYTKTITKADGCLDVIISARTQFDLDANWIKSSGNKQLVLNLAGQKNVYQAVYTPYQLSLTRVQAVNVMSEGKVGDDVTVLKVSLDPKDVAIIFLSGSLDISKDYRSELMAFAEAKGFTPADKIYKGLEQSKKDSSSLKVIVPTQDLPNPNESKSLGSLPNSSNIEVNLDTIPDVVDSI